jgi:hypothetical protein
VLSRTLDEPLCGVFVVEALFTDDDVGLCVSPTVVDNKFDVDEMKGAVDVVKSRLIGVVVLEVTAAVLEARLASLAVDDKRLDSLLVDDI